MTKAPGPRRPDHLCPIPFGAHVERQGATFTLFSRHARRVWILLFSDPDADAPDQEIELTPERHRTGDVWHVYVPGVKAGQLYVYRMEGQSPKGFECVYDPDQWLLDPFALAVYRPGKWGHTGGLPPGQHVRNGQLFPKGVILRETFNWGQDQPPSIPAEDTIYYETHVRGYTVHPSSGVSAMPGTYAALVEKIPHIKKLGVRSVELLPIHEFNEMEYYREGDSRQDLRNFWGYSTRSFFAPNGRYAAAGSAGRQVHEFKKMVKAFHAAGLEVILDVVYNHTGEGGRGGPVTSFRGIDQSVYYMMEPDGKHHRNFTGCGNTVNTNHPVVQDLILHSLRYWKHHMRVDGFRFDLASIFTRGLDGEVLDRYSIVDRIAEDPLLRDAKLVAEAWDAAGLYQVGSFPNLRWSEWNGRFRDDVRRFWKGDHGMLHPFSERMMGSPDLYAHWGGTPQKSVNLVTCHDGFTLRDLACYAHKHNEANQEENRDGENHNHSINFGVEGPSDDPAIEALRLRHQKNLIATTLLAHGTPLILAGDEFSRTQHGNNNSYCQDNELSWVDWEMLDDHQELLRFTRRAIRLRTAQPALRTVRFMHRGHRMEEATEIWWFNIHLQEPNWGSDRCVGCWISGRGKHTGREDGADILILFNAATHPVEFLIPESRGQSWRLALYTQEKRPVIQRASPRFLIDASSLSVWTSSV